MATARTCSKCDAPLPSNAPEGICPKCLLHAGFPSEPVTARFTPPQSADLANEFPELDILELLGKGGMGAVYKARQKQLNRYIALKILPPEVGDDPAFEARFTREAQTLARLNHPNIVQVYDFGKAGRYFYFLMEFVDGSTVRDVIESGGLEPRQALAIVPAVCSALQFAHDTGVVHRDIKPENILLDQQGRVKIADFGLAMLLDREPAELTLTEAGQVMGTPQYMAPEQMRGSHAIDHRADIYSLGVVFYEMLTGELPVGHFEVPSRKLRVDVRLDEVVLRTLASEPDRRYQHASDVKHDVEQLSVPESDSGDRITAPDAGVKDEQRSTSRVPLLVGGNLWLLAAIVLLLGKNVARTQPLMYSFFGFGAWVYPATYHLLVAGCVFLSAACFVMSWRSHGHRRRHETATENALSSAPAPAVMSAAESETIVTAPTIPRVSRKAVVGAIWASFFFLALFFATFIQVSTFQGSNPVITESAADGASASPLAEAAAGESVKPPPMNGLDSPDFRPERTWWQWLLMFTVLPLGLTAPFGTTGLGIAAISGIRHSHGRLVGLPLAVFDALLFPLLLLNALLVAALVTSITAIFGSGMNLIAMSLMSLLLSLVVDVLIVRAVWRRVRRPG